jgi:predicted AAA+ superfamily ATPase
MAPGFYAYLRYFKEKAPEYRVITAGSLFEFEIKRENAPQGPTGRVEYAYLSPMTFEEFLLAKNPLAHKKFLSLSIKTTIDGPLHKVFTDLFKEYLVSGGMPEVVKALRDGEGPLRLDEIKSNIITGYILDLPKYSELSNKKYNSELLEILFKAVLARPANSMKYSELAPGYRAEVVRKHLNVMEDARIIRQSFHSGENKVPVSIGAKKKDYKLFALDIGLCYSHMNLPITKIYTSDDINDLSKGVLAEQYVAQTMVALPPYHKVRSLHHWQRQKKNAQSEVDFVTEREGIVIPVECKSGFSSKMTSLRIMLKEKHYPMALRVYAGNIQQETLDNNNEQAPTKLISIPHYLLERFMENAEEFLLEMLDDEELAKVVEARKIYRDRAIDVNLNDL